MNFTRKPLSVFFKCAFLRFLFGELRFKEIVTDLNYPSEILPETSNFEVISILSSLEAKTLFISNNLT